MRKFLGKKKRKEYLFLASEKGKIEISWIPNEEIGLGEFNTHRTY